MELKCLCCFSSKKSVIICTLLIIIIELIKLEDSFLHLKRDKPIPGFHTGFNYINIIAVAITFLTLILLLIGIATNKVTLMKPFKLIYAIYIFYMILYQIIQYKKLKNIYNSPGEHTDYREYCESKHSSKELDKALNKYQEVLSGCVIYSIAYIVYYVTTVSYIWVKEEEVDSDIKSLVDELERAEEKAEEN